MYDVKMTESCSLRLMGKLSRKVIFPSIMHHDGLGSIDFKIENVYTRNKINKGGAWKERTQSLLFLHELAVYLGKVRWGSYKKIYTGRKYSKVAN